MSERKYAYNPEYVSNDKQSGVFFKNISISDSELIQLTEVHKTFQLFLQDSEGLISLFDRPEIAKFKIEELKEFGKCRARIVDESKNYYWAELLLLCDDIVEVRDVNTQEEFLIDGEDLLEELERHPENSVTYSVSIC